MLHEHIEPENKMTQSLAALYVYIWHTGFNKKNLAMYTLQNLKSIKIKVLNTEKGEEIKDKKKRSSLITAKLEFSFTHRSNAHSTL